MCRITVLLLCRISMCRIAGGVRNFVCKEVSCGFTVNRDTSSDDAWM